MKKVSKLLLATAIPSILACAIPVEASKGKVRTSIAAIQADPGKAIESIKAGNVKDAIANITATTVNARDPVGKGRDEHGEFDTGGNTLLMLTVMELTNPDKQHEKDKYVQIAKHILSIKECDPYQIQPRRKDKTGERDALYMMAAWATHGDKEHNEIIKLILDKKKDETKKNINRRVQMGRTTLAEAVANGNLGMVRMLLAAGAKASQNDKNGMPILHHASWETTANKDAIIAELLKALKKEKIDPTNLLYKGASYTDPEPQEVKDEEEKK